MTKSEKISIINNLSVNFLNATKYGDAFLLRIEITDEIMTCPYDPNVFLTVIEPTVQTLCLDIDKYLNKLTLGYNELTQELKQEAEYSLVALQNIPSMSLLPD